MNEQGVSTAARRRGLDVDKWAAHHPSRDLATWSGETRVALILSRGLATDDRSKEVVANEAPGRRSTREL